MPQHRTSPKPQTIYTVQDAIVATLDQASANGQPIKALAWETRIPIGRLYSIYETQKRLWAEEIPVLVRATGNPLILDVLARAAAGAFVPLPVTRRESSSDAVQCSADAMQAFGQLMQVYAAALLDETSADEAEVIAGKAYAAVVRILTLVERARANVRQEISCQTETTFSERRPTRTRAWI